MGFAVYRIDADGQGDGAAVDGGVPGLHAQARPDDRESFPVQKFYWKDPYARLVAEKTGNRRFRYKVVPLDGKPGSLTPMTVAFLVSNEVEIVTDRRAEAGARSSTAG